MQPSLGPAQGERGANYVGAFHKARRCPRHGRSAAAAASTAVVTADDCDVDCELWDNKDEDYDNENFDNNDANNVDGGESGGGADLDKDDDVAVL